MPNSAILLEHVTDDLARQGWSVMPDFLPQQATEILASEALQLRQNDALRPAGIGKGAERTVNSDIRGDFILWLEQHSRTAAQCNYLQHLEELRLAVNAGLQLGLFEFEGHLALYPPGSFYRKHLDRFQNDSLRALTVILYLNTDWKEEDGGQLRIFTGEQEYFDVQPASGTLITFLSGRFWHEVLPASRERISITGWFKTRGGSMP